jgi:succinoglycan biosynthesis transport protein ExoP
MELRDFLQLLRRGWTVVVLLTIVGLGAAAFYLAVTPKTFTATSSVVLVTNNPLNIGDAQAGGQLALSAAPTIAGIIDSPAVLSSVSTALDSSIATSDLVGMVTANARTGTSVIDIAVSGSDARQVAEIANLTARDAGPVVTTVEGKSKATGVSPLKLEQIVSASVPGFPTSPDTKGVLLIGFIIGLALGIVLAVLRHALDTRIYDDEGLRRLNDTPVLAVIPRAMRPSARNKRRTGEGLFGPGVEGFRTLRTNLGYLESSERHCFAIMASGNQTDGAATAVNLAVSVAQSGRRVLLIDCDLRRNAVGELLGLEHGVGLADLLIGFGEPTEITRSTEHPQLSAILAGTPQRNPSDLLSSPSMSLLLRHAEAEYDDVILHAPFLEGYSDAAVVARVAAWTILIVLAGRTTVRQFDEAMGALERVHVAPVGLVLVGKSAGLIAGLRNRRRPSWSVPAANPRVASSKKN